jgi:hypothetical protein
VVGTPDGDGPSVYAHGPQGMGLTLDEAEEFARAILEAVEEARS